MFSVRLFILSSVESLGMTLLALALIHWDESSVLCAFKLEESAKSFKAKSELIGFFGFGLSIGDTPNERKFIPFGATIGVLEVPISGPLLTVLDDDRGQSEGLTEETDMDLSTDLAFLLTSCVCDFPKLVKFSLAIFDEPGGETRAFPCVPPFPPAGLLNPKSMAEAGSFDVDLDLLLSS